MLYVVDNKSDDSYGANLLEMDLALRSLRAMLYVLWDWAN